MFNRIGTKIYYCNITGNILQIIGDAQGFVKETSFEEDIKIYSELKERDVSSIGLLQFEYGEYTKLSQGCTGVIVNIETKELIFTYDELPNEPQEPTEIDIIQDKILVLEEKNELLEQELSITQDAVNELIFNSLNM